MFDKRFGRLIHEYLFVYEDTLKILTPGDLLPV
jgi:hypothetical protein